MARINIGNVKYKPAVGMHHIQFSGEPTPAEIWAGTTWEIDTEYQGRTIIGSGGDYTLGATGGSLSHTHGSGSIATLFALNNEAIGSSNWVMRTIDTSGWDRNYNVDMGGAGGASTAVHTKGIATAGETAPGYAIPPYTVVNYWKRTV